MKPLFDVHLKIWENWPHFWNSLPWIVRKMSGYKTVGTERMVAGAFDPKRRVVHLFMDEIAQDALNRLEAGKVFTKDNYDLNLVTRMFHTIAHELIHSLPIFDSEQANDNHIISLEKCNKAADKSMWYVEMIRLMRLADTKIYVTDSSIASGSSGDFSG